MYSHFKNEPNCSLSGRTFDAKHLDRFLTTNHGNKLATELFPGYKSPQSNTHKFEENKRAIQTNIRPSSNFLSIGREIAVNTLEKNDLMPFQDIQTPQQQIKNPQKFGEKLRQINPKELGLKQEAVFSTPQARRQELNLAQKRLRSYQELKEA